MIWADQLSGQSICGGGLASSWVWKFPAQWLRYQLDFPQVGVMIDRLARLVGNERSKHTRDFVAYQDVLDWVERAGRLGWDKLPDAATREAFRNWIDFLDCQGRPGDPEL